MLGEIAGRQLVEAVEIDLLVVQLVEEALELAGEPHRLLVRHARAAREHQPGQQQAAPERADRRRQSQLELGVEQQLGLVGLADRQQARQQQRLAAAERRKASRAARQARRLGSSSSVSASRSRSQPSSAATSVSRNGRSAAMVWTFGIARDPSRARSRREAWQERRPAAGAVELSARRIRPRSGTGSRRDGSRSAGQSPGARSGHSTSSAPRCQHSSSPSSATSLVVVQAVEVGVADLQPRQLVSLDQREGRARHRDLRPGRAADHRPGELALAGAEIALEQDDRARRQGGGEPPAERPGRGEIGQEQAALGLLHARPGQ